MWKRVIIGVSVCLMMWMGASHTDAAVLHQIRKGESLYKIAVKSGTTVKELKQANGLQSNTIIAGKKLTIPTESKSAHSGAANVTRDSRTMELLARLIHAEAGAESYKGKVAVGAVIINRCNDGRFPRTIAGNIFKPHEFESVSNGYIWTQPTADCYKAAKAALNGWDPTNGAKFFFNPAKVSGGSWMWTRTIIQRIGNHVFAV
ncbi:MAG: cell wall hydrolase [Bacillota bacterium]